MKTKRGRKWLCGVGTLAVCCMLTGCHMSHEWQEATCTTPKTCSVGGETEGEALGHTWVEATCAEPKTCSVCGETEGEALEHTLTEANYQQAATCEVCGETVGEPLTAYFEEEGIVCDAQLDTAYPYTVLCYENNNYTTTGTVTFSDYEIFASDETYEALEGYEWQAITLTFIFSDDNAHKYGFSMFPHARDYYEEADSGFNTTYTINYNGKDYDECIRKYEEYGDGWVGQTGTWKYRLVMRVPEGYDGVVALAENNITDTTIETIYFRLK